MESDELYSEKHATNNTMISLFHSRILQLHDNPNFQISLKTDFHEWDYLFRSVIIYKIFRWGITAFQYDDKSVFDVVN